MRTWKLLLVMASVAGAITTGVSSVVLMLSLID
jgi:hypothetical protein